MILHDDCFNALANIPDGSVDMILTDPPYGTTSLEWDTVPDLARMFAEFNRVIKKNAAIVVTAQQPFATDCIVANRKYFRYEWIWEKTSAAGFLNANKMPMRAHENVLVFYQSLPTYNAQKGEAVRGRNSNTATGSTEKGEIYNSKRIKVQWHDNGLRYPRTIITFAQDRLIAKSFIKTGSHPTQKPVALFEYLIRTYTNEGETVLDCFAGSGTTAVAAINTGRKYIVVEKEQKYVEIIRERVAQAEQKLFTSVL